MIRGKWCGLLALAGLTAVVPQGAQAAWLQAKSEHFTIYSEGNQEKLLDFAQKLEKFDFLLRTVTGMDEKQVSSPVQVFLLAKEEKIKELAHNPNAAGFYSTSNRFAYAVLARGKKVDEFDLGAEEVLFHEYTHHFMLHNFPAAYPAWYIEGFAEFFSVVKFPRDGTIEYGHIPMVRAPTLLMANTYPIKELFERNADKLGLMQGDRYYGTAWLLTHYFQYKADRRKEMVSYLHDLAKGVPDMKPDSYFAGGLVGLEKDLRAYMRQRLFITRLSSQAVKIGEIAITPVDPVRGALIEDELRVIGHVHEDEWPGIVESVRRDVSKFPSSAYAIALLAEAEAGAGKKDEALADADRAIALDPNLSRAYSTRAEILLDRAHDSGRDEDWKAARTAIVRANRTDTEDLVPLMLFYRYYAMKGGVMPQVGYDGLEKAFALLPQNADYRFAWAQAMAGKGNYATASRLLTPLAYSPHESEGREAALKLKTEYDAEAEKSGKIAAAH